MNLTKTDFILYLNCSKSFWYFKRKNHIWEENKAEDNSLKEDIIKNGYLVERYAKSLFNTGREVGRQEKTQRVLQEDFSFFFEPTFLLDNGVLARADILEKNTDGTFNLYEIKSSTKIKTDKSHNHFKDVSFQKYAIENSGYKLKNTFLIYLNSQYKKNGQLNIKNLFVIQNINQEVEKIYQETVLEIKNALEILSIEEWSDKDCPCLKKTRSNHCNLFSYFNFSLTENSIYNLSRLSAKNLNYLLSLNIRGIEKIPEDFKLNFYQEKQKESLKKTAPFIDRIGIKNELNSLQFPIYFFDYETINKAIPEIDGFGPYEQIPFQFSLHVLEESGQVKHYEYLSSELKSPEELIKFLQEKINYPGSLISWNASFEKTINKKLSLIYPQYANFLLEINDRTFDLEIIFKKSYIDSRFLGRSSIKSVLPILIPNLTYKGLEVSNGAEAISWGQKMFEEKDLEKKQKIRKSLLEYCKLDTESMLLIYQKLKQENS